MSEKIGRKRSMLLVNIPLLITWLLLYFATNLFHLYLGLCLAGVSGGMLDTPAHIYTGETTQPRYRGMLATTGTIWFILGLTSQFFLGMFWEWRTVALFNCCIPILAFCFLCLIPESPYWLIQKGRYEDAQKSFAWLRGWVPIEKIEPEYDMVRENLESESNVEKKKANILATLKLYKSSHFLVPFGLVCIAFVMAHFCGLTALQTYAVSIFKMLQVPLDEYVATFLLGIAQLVGGIFCIAFVHRLGKRPIVFISTIGCGLCFLGAALYVHYMDILETDDGNTTMVMIPTHYTMADPMLVGNSIKEFEKQIDLSNVTTLIEMETFAESNKLKFWVPLVLLIGSAIFASGGIIIIPWILIAEIFPSSVRSVAAGISIGTGHVFAFLANKLFLDMMSLMSLQGTFGFYAFISLAGTVILYYALPETEGRTLQEIESHYTGGPKLTDRKSSVAQKGFNNTGYNRDEFL